MPISEAESSEDGLDEVAIVERYLICRNKRLLHLHNEVKIPPRCLPYENK